MNINYKVEAGNLNEVIRTTGQGRARNKALVLASSEVEQRKRVSALTEEERMKAQLIAYAATGVICLGFSIWAAADAWNRTHMKSRALGAFVAPPIWLLVRPA